MGDDDFLDGGFPEGGGFQVDFFLAVEGEPFDVFFIVLVCVVDVGEAGYAVNYGGAAEVVGCFVLLVVLEGFIGLLFEVGGGLEEGMSVLICGSVVDVFLVSLAKNWYIRCSLAYRNQVLEDRPKVLDTAIVKRIDGFLALLSSTYAWIFWLREHTANFHRVSHRILMEPLCG